MNIPIPKLKALLLYFCENTDSKFLGKVKLMKLFYFVDFLHVKKYGTPVTFDRYIKLEYGPIPSTVKNLVDDAETDIDNSILADTIDIKQNDGMNMHKVVARRKLNGEDLKLFTPSEINILQQVCKRFGASNTDLIKEVSHNEAPWRESQWYQEIPYTLATHDPDCETSIEEIELGLKILAP